MYTHTIIHRPTWEREKKLTLSSLVVVLITNALTIRKGHVLDVFILCSFRHDQLPGFLNRFQDVIVKSQRDWGSREIVYSPFANYCVVNP